MQKQKYKRFTIIERRAVEQGLNARQSLRSIGMALNRTTSTVSREILRNAVHRKTGADGWAEFNDCANRDDCGKSRICSNPGCGRQFCCGCKFCFHVCRDYVRERCRLVEAPPYVCNGCKGRGRCTLEKVFYKAGIAQKSADEVLRSSRSGIDITEAERDRLDGIVTPLVKQGQSPYHILKNNRDALMVSAKTLYTYIAAGLFTAKSTDLRCKVKMKPRKAKKAIRIDRACMAGRTREDFLSYMKEHPDTAIVEMDTVIGKKGRGEKVLLTVHFPVAGFMLAFIRDANTAKSVTDIFARLRKTLGYETFHKAIPLLVTDRGSEFTNPAAIEQRGKNRAWTRVFYCDPYSPYQKPCIENNHRMIRMVLPKGTSFNGLTQDGVDLMMSHINSYARDALGGRRPIDVFADMYGEETVKKLGVRRIHANDIVLKPSLLN